MTLTADVRFGLRMLGVALAATLVPGRRALRVDPLVAIRYD